MKYITLANLRSGGGRLIAAGIAVLISVAFIAVVISLTDAFDSTLRKQAVADNAGADIVVFESTQYEGSDDPKELSSAEADALTKVAGVASAQLIEESYAETKVDDSTRALVTSTLPDTRPMSYVAGGKPTSDTDIVLFEAEANKLRVGVGSTLTLTEPDFGNGGSAAGKSFTVSGLISDADGYGKAFLTSQGLHRSSESTVPTSIRIATDEPADSKALAQTQEAVAKAVGSSAKQQEDGSWEAKGLTVSDNDQIVQAQLKEMTGQSAFLAYIVLGFAAIAIVVAALVISNTFQVLVASRTRSLALMRAVGATRGQIRSAMLTEGLVLGFIGSVAGLLVGWGAAVGLGYAARSLWLPTFVAPGMPVLGVIAGMAVGVLVTVAACIVPARMATRVSPIQALAPIDVPAPDTRFPWVRLVVGGLMTAGGLGLALFGALDHEFLLALGGGLVGFIGVLVLTRVIVPPLVTLFGRILAALSGGSPAMELVPRSIRMAPSRTSSTTAALLIGVTLVSTMMVGAQSVTDTTSTTLVKENAVDVVANGDAAKKIAEQSSAVTTISTLEGARAQASINGAGDRVQVEAATESGTAAARSSRLIPPRGTAFISETPFPGQASEQTRAEFDGKTITLSSNGEDVTLTARVADGVPAGTVLAFPSDISPLNPTAATGQTWMRVSDSASPQDVTDLQTSLQTAGIQANAEGALTRAYINQVVTVMLSIVLVLLGASVVIAIVGVGNTLSLSVFERRREAALLRAMGMSRGSVGALITVEAVLMAVVASVLGIALGAFFGWAGTSSLLGLDSVTVVLGIPWLQIAAVIVVAIVASLLAAALPARSISRVAPAAGLSG